MSAGLAGRNAPRPFIPAAPRPARESGNLLGTTHRPSPRANPALALWERAAAKRRVRVAAASGDALDALTVARAPGFPPTRHVEEFYNFYDGELTMGHLNRACVLQRGASASVAWLVESNGVSCGAAPEDGLLTPRCLPAYGTSTGGCESAASAVLLAHDAPSPRREAREIGEWRSPAARYVRDVEAPGSNPGSPTSFLPALHRRRRASGTRRAGTPLIRTHLPEGVIPSRLPLLRA